MDCSQPILSLGHAISHRISTCEENIHIFVYIFKEDELIDQQIHEKQ